MRREKGNDVYIDLEFKVNREVCPLFQCLLRVGGEWRLQSKGRVIRWEMGIDEWM